jgi:Vitamin B6 photo-protection and homoeostasis
VLNAVALPFFFRAGSLRIVALCLSGSLRSLCSIAAGGSKTAISSHFATPLTGRGDLGDLNAKESSLETVLCLVGMLVSRTSPVECIEGLSGALARDFDYSVPDNSMVDVHRPVHPSHHPSCDKLYRRSWNRTPYAQSAENTDCLDSVQTTQQLNNQPHTASDHRANIRGTRCSSRCAHGKNHRSLYHWIIPLRHLTQTFTTQFIGAFRL